MPGFGRATGGTSVVPGSTAAEEQHRIRKAQDNGTLEETVAKAASGTPAQRIASIVKASGATLPSRLTLGLAQADTPDQELRKASQLIARQLDVPPEYLLQPAGTAPLSGYVDPVTGGTISLETARRVIKPYEPKIIQSMFADYLTPQPVRMGPNGERIKAAPATTPTRLAKAFIALAPVDGKTLDFAHAASAALSLARSKGNLEVFTNNLQIALRAKGLTPLMAIKAAELGAQNGQTFGSVEDVARIVLPPEAAANIAGAEARQHNIEAVGAAGGYGGLEEQRAAAKNAAIAAAAQGNAGVQANPAHGIPVSSYGVSMSAALLGALKNGEGDYNAEAAKITAEMQADHNVFKNSWVYSAVFHPLGEVIKYTSGAADVTAFVGAQLVRHSPVADFGSKIPVVGHTLAELGTLGLYDPKQPEQHDLGTYLHNQWNVAKDLLYQRNTFGTWYTEHAGLPSWVGGPIELAVQFGLSPDAIALRALSDFRAARLISSGDTFVQNAHRFVYGPMRRFGILPGSRANFADRLAATLDEARTPEQAFVRQVDLTRTFFTSDGLDARTVAGMWEYAKSAKAGGASTKEIADGIRFFLGRSLGLVGEAPVGSLARYVEQYHRDLQTIADNTLPFDIAKPGGYTDAEKYAASEAERALGIVDQWDQYTMAHGPIQLEVPHGVGIPRRALSSLRANRFIGDSNIWRDVSALFNSTPGIQGGRLIINAEQNPATDLVEVMKRGRVFSQEELATARLEMSSAASPINATRELSIGNTVKKYEGQMLTRIEAQQGLTPKMGEEVRNLSGGMFEAQRPRMTFGAEPEVDAAGNVVGRKGVTVPLLPSQLPNTYEFIDPVWYRRGITEAMGVTRKFRNGVLRASHLGIPEAKLAHSIHGVSLTLPKVFHDTVDLLVRGLFLNIWKPLVVLRPAYVVRVVGIEEQARFLSTMGLMSRLESGKVGSRIFNAVDAVRGDSRYYEYAVDRVDEAGNTIHDLFQWERRPGRLTNEALAANTNATLAFPGSDAVSRKLLDYLNARKWDTLGQDDPQFFDAWQHDLVNQAGKDPVGRIYLSGIRDNKTDESIISDAEKYLNTPLGRKDATRLMGPDWDPEQLHSTLEQGVRIFRAYTPKSEIAQAALDGTLTLDDLKAVPAGARPTFVHGPELEATLAREGPVKKLVGGIHKLILQKPTNALSRQPFCKAWYQRILKSMLDNAAASVTPTEYERILSYDKELADTRVVDSSGQPLRVYHGTTRPFDVFDEGVTRDGLYGHGFYFAENPKVAGGDNSIFGGAGYARGYTTTGRQTTIRIPVSEAPTAEDAIRLARERIPEGTYLGDRGGFIENFGLKPGEKPRSGTWEVNVGVQEGTPNVHFNYLDIKHPFDASRPLSAEEVNRIDEAAARLSNSKAQGTLAEEFAGKDGRDLYNYLAQAQDSDFANRVLEDAGYDGVFHVGREDGRVWVAFHPEQVHVGVPSSIVVPKIGTGGARLTPALIDNMQKEARRFALGQVNRIMFDFTRQNRLGEMVNWLIPFFQPYSEAFTVWSRILATNPQVASYVTKLYHVGKETGFIKKDPTTGEDTISLGWWADALSWATLGHVSLPDGFKASAPLNSINFFFQASLPIPTGGIAGDVPIPLPGFNPEALAILQKVVDGGQVGPWKIPDGARARMTSYLFQYGSVTGSSLLPTWLRHAMTGLGLVGGNPDELNSTAIEFLRLYQKLGMSPSTTHPLPDMSRTAFFALTPEDRITAWKTYLSDKATEQAKHMEYFRAAGSAFFPASPRITSPVAGAEKDLEDLRTKYGYQKGTDYFLSDTATGIPYVDSRRHPDLALTTIGKSIWTGGEAGSQALGAGSPVPIPANPYVTQLLKTKGAKAFAQKYPEWLWAIIPSELRDAQFDQSSYFDQIGQGLRDVLNPMDYLSKSEQQKGWDNYFAIRTRWTNWQETHPDLTEGTASFIQAKGELYDQPIEALKRDNHDWALEFGTFNTQGVDANVMAHARALVKKPMFLQTDAGAGLKEYLDLRDEIRAKMVQQNITTITTKAAGDAGLTDQYNLGVDQIIRAHPDFKTAYDFFFGNDLQGVPTYQERILNKAPPEVVTQINSWESQYKAAQAAIDTATDPLARSQAFIDLRNLEDQAATQFSPTYNPQMLQWKSLTPAAQDQRRTELLSKPYVFLTQFERSTILGDPTNSAAETVWEQYDASLLEIQKYERDNPAAPVGPLYDQVNAQLAQLASNNPTLATQLQHANDWTYTPRTLIKGANDPSDAAFAYWGSFLDAVHSVEVAAVKGDLHGISSGTAEQQTWWGTMQKNLEGYRDQLFQQSPIFQNEYLQAEKNSPSDTLIENLMPDTFYPVGGPQFVSP